VEASSVASADGASVAVVDADFALPVPKMRSASRMMTCKKIDSRKKKVSSSTQSGKLPNDLKTRKKSFSSSPHSGKLLRHYKAREAEKA
jgi:hypothetical protein